ncbi:MAG: hypothetical protein ACAI35_28385 [Candidatus Methylacidiphilales bacterium]|nr:hypothetical protein [Candidatus Methylacidiphilales bacterium]
MATGDSDSPSTAAPVVLASDAFGCAEIVEEEALSAAFFMNISNKDFHPQ